MKPDLAVANVQWALGEGYKLAVLIRGINDWTNDFKTIEAREKAQREVEQYQIEIAKMIITSLFSDRKIRTT